MDFVLFFFFLHEAGSPDSDGGCCNCGVQIKTHRLSLREIKAVNPHLGISAQSALLQIQPSVPQGGEAAPGGALEGLEPGPGQGRALGTDPVTPPGQVEWGTKQIFVPLH